MRQIWAAEGGLSVEQVNAGTHKYLGQKSNAMTEKHYADPSSTAMSVMNRKMKEGASPNVASKYLRDIMSNYSVGKNLPKKMAIADMAKEWSSRDCKKHENLWLGKQIFETKQTAELPSSLNDLDAALLPMRIIKEFQVDEVKEFFFGEIISVEEVEDDDGKISSQLKIIYDDGDKEHLTVEEGQEARDAYVKKILSGSDRKRAMQFNDAVLSAYAHHCTTSKGKPGTKRACDEWKLAAAVFYSNDEQEYEKVNAKRAREKKVLQLERLAHLHLIALLHECETQHAYKDTFWDFIEPANKINDHESTKVSVARFLIILSLFLASSSYLSAAKSL